MIDERIFEGLERAKAVAEYVEERHEAFFFLKSDDFATEYEHRAVLAAGDDEYFCVEYRDALVGVVLGERFPLRRCTRRSSSVTTPTRPTRLASG